MAEVPDQPTKDLDITVFRPDRPGVRKVLGDLEADIMELIWARPNEAGTTVREIFEILYEQRRIAYTTVMNTMARLARKNLLRVQKGEQAYVYYPNLTEQQFVSRFVARILEDLLVSFAGPAGQVPGPGLDRETAERVRQLLDEISRRRAAEEAE